MKKDRFQDNYVMTMRLMDKVVHAWDEELGQKDESIYSSMPELEKTLILNGQEIGNDALLRGMIEDVVSRWMVWDVVEDDTFTVDDGGYLLFSQFEDRGGTHLTTGDTDEEVFIADYVVEVKVNGQNLMKEELAGIMGSGEE